MAAMMIGSFSNIILDYIFIFPMKMGIFGAIFTTGLSPVISIIIILSHWIKRKNTFHVCRTKLKAHIIRQELALGFPSLIAQLSSGIVMITFNAIILKLESNTGVAAYGVIANISLVVVAIYDLNAVQRMNHEKYSILQKALWNYNPYHNMHKAF